MTNGSLPARALRRLVPRPVRNLFRSPYQTARWLAGEASFVLGRRQSVTILDGWTLRCHPACLAALDLHAQDPVLRAEIVSFVKSCRKGMSFLDVGASFGVFSLAAAHYGGPFARVVAVDPSPVSNRILRANLMLNAAAERVQLI